MKIDTKAAYYKYMRSAKLPLGTKGLGCVEIQRGDCPITGALVLAPSGQYVLINGQVIVTLDDQEEVKRQLAEQTAIKVDKKHYDLYLDAPSVETLRRYGDGNLSLGVRRAADLVKLCSPSDGT